MQRIGMLQAFAPVKEGEDAVFVHPQGNQDQARQVKMRVLSEHDVNLYLVPVEFDHEANKVKVRHDDPDFIQFLAHVRAGMDEIEFFWKGSFALRVLGGGIWLDTYDNTAFNVESADPVSFARIWEREERDPRILEIEQIARHNRMMLEQERARDRADYEQRLKDMEERFKNVTQAPGTSDAPASSGGKKGSGVPSAGDPKPDQPADSGAGGEPDDGA